MKLVKFLLILSFGLLMAAAPNVKTPKFGFVNFEAALSQELQAQQVIGELEAEEIKLNQAFQQAQADLEQKVAAFKATAASLNNKAKEEAEMKLGNEYGALQQKFSQDRMNSAQKRQVELGKLEEKNRVLLNDISQKGGYDLVFNSAALVYVSDEIKKNDLTQSLITAYNNAFKPEVKAQPKPQAQPKAPAKNKK